MAGWWPVRAAAAAMLCLAAAGCARDGGTPPTPGTLSVVLTGSAGARAVVLELSGPGIETFEAASPAYELHYRPGSGGFRMAVFGELQPGPLVRFRVADASRPGRYRVRLVEAADEENLLLTEAGRVVLSVSP